MQSVCRRKLTGDGDQGLTRLRRGGLGRRVDGGRLETVNLAKRHKSPSVLGPTRTSQARPRPSGRTSSPEYPSAQAAV